MTKNNSYKSILALDIATRTGYAHWRPHHLPDIGTYKTPDCGDAIGRSLYEFEKWLRRTLVEKSVDFVVFEAPILISKGPKKTGMKVAYKLYNLAGTLERLCCELDIPCAKVEVSEWRKHFLGDGGYSTDEAKRLCMERVQELGYNPKHHDAAEAFGILDYTAAVLEMETDWADFGLLGKMKG